MSKTGICVYGGSTRDADQAYVDAAFELGKQIGLRGWRLIFGAGDTGMMGAAARGIKSVDGEAIGIAPFFFDQPGVLYENLDSMLFVRTMRERKAFMESLSSGFVVTPGGIGTLEEFYEILTLKQLRQLDAPLVLLDTEGYYSELLVMMDKMEERHFLTDDTQSLYYVAKTVEEAMLFLDENI
jgi:uncharacterized protein (TIGR00730 family)